MRSRSSRHLSQTLRRYWPELVLALFAAANVAVMLVVAEAETIPFHFIWLSLAILYGFRVWRLGSTLAVLGVVCVVAGGALAYDQIVTDGHFDELAEVPMMAAMFLAMVWHAQRRQAAVERMQLATMRERDFTRDASHQLRTPISIARGHVELVQLRTADSQVADDAEVILGELDRLTRISDRMLILAMADQDDFLAPTTLDLGQLVQKTARRWTATAHRDWRIRVRAPHTLLGDADRLEAALDALIENAVKATDEGDRIEVELRPRGNTATIEVSDSGVGIAPDEVGRVFDRFWHSNHSEAGTRQGTGLGLAMVRAIAEAHGGSAKAVPLAAGGTAVRMVLPTGGNAGPPRADRLVSGRFGPAPGSAWAQEPRVGARDSS
jgi:signal transduction histidine kinase